MEHTPLNALRILVIDDHPIVAQGITSVVKAHLSITDVEQANHDTAIAEARKNRGKVLFIVDLELKDDNGFQLIEQLIAQHRNNRILVYTMHEEPWVKKKLHTLNVDGAVAKSEPIDLLIKAVKEIMMGNRWFSPVFALSPESGITPRKIEISDRERQVLKMLSEGDTSDEIAQKLSISINTIHTYRRRLMGKFGVTNVAELIFQTKGLI